MFLYRSASCMLCRQVFHLDGAEGKVMEEVVVESEEEILEGPAEEVLEGTGEEEMLEEVVVE